MERKLTAKIVKLIETSGTSANGEWKRQDVLLQTEEQYPESVAMSVRGSDKIKEMDLKEGETVTVYYSFRMREWNGKYFNDINIWKVER